MAVNKITIKIKLTEKNYRISVINHKLIYINYLKIYMKVRGIIIGILRIELSDYLINRSGCELSPNEFRWM